MVAVGTWATVLGYVILQTNGGDDLHWTANNPPYQFNVNGSADLGDEVFSSMDGGFQVWNDDSGIGYSFAGCTNKGRSSVIDGSGDADSDGSSIVTWIENSWPYPPSTIAITWTFFNPDDGVIGEADMLMNGDDYSWTTANAGGDTDVQSITAHEAGHYLGLGHSTVSAATMFPTVNQGDISLRSLHADDIAGGQDLYPGGSTGASYNGLCEATDDEPGEGCACSMVRNQPRGGLLAGILSVVLLGVAGTLRLRRARLAIPRIALPVVAAIAMFATSDASATVMLDQSIEQLAADSEAVVHGDVETVIAETDGRTIRTISTVRVRATIAGEPVSDVVEIVTPGGELPKGVQGPNGYRGLRAEGVPKLEPGQELVLFLDRRPDGALTITSFQQGVLRVQRGAKGVATVDRDLSGILRMVRTPTGLQPVEGDELSGIPLDVVLKRIQAAPISVSP